MKEYKFDTRSTSVLKGLLIIFLLIHHLFNEATVITDRKVITLFLDPLLSQSIARYFRICVGGFAFLTAYGMSAKFNKIEKMNNNSMFLISIDRYIKLLFSFEFVYVIALLVSRFVFKNSIAATYAIEGKFKYNYMIYDALGLANFFGSPSLNATWWYMSFAILLIFIVPVLFIGYKRMGVVLLPFFALIPLKLLAPNMEVNALLFPALLGIFFETENIFPRLKNIGKEKWYAKIIKILISLFLIFITYSISDSMSFSLMLYGTCSILYAYICFEFLENIPVIGSVLNFLGKHSMNIFFVHTFIYLYYFSDFIYSFQYDYIIVTVLLLICIAISLVLEGTKYILQYNKLMYFCIKRINQAVEKTGFLKDKITG